jgi:hypothetical protein
MWHINDCAQSYTFKAAITIVVTGFVGASKYCSGNDGAVAVEAWARAHGIPDKEVLDREAMLQLIFNRFVMG